MQKFDFQIKNNIHHNFIQQLATQRNDARIIKKCSQSGFEVNGTMKEI